MADPTDAAAIRRDRQIRLLGAAVEPRKEDAPAVDPDQPRPHLSCGKSGIDGVHAAWQLGCVVGAAFAVVPANYTFSASAISSARPSM